MQSTQHTYQETRPLICLLTALLIGIMLPLAAHSQSPLIKSTECRAPAYLGKDWQETDFSKCTVDLSKIISGGPGKDGIPSIDQPVLCRSHKWT